MCNIHSFYYVCGHTYLSTVISCPDAVDRAVAERSAIASNKTPHPVKRDEDVQDSGGELQLEHLSPISAAFSSQLSPSHSPVTSCRSDDDLESLSPILMHSPLLSSVPHLQPCPDASISPSIIPFSCEPCITLEQMSESVSAPSQQRATYNLVQACKAQLRRSHSRERSEVASPVFSPIDADEDEGYGTAGSEAQFNEHDASLSRISDTSGMESSTSGTRRISDCSSLDSSKSNGELKSRIASVRKRLMLGMGRSEGEIGLGREYEQYLMENNRS